MASHQEKFTNLEGNPSLDGYTAIFNIKWSIRQVSDDLSKAIICSIYKKVNHQECAHYRGITLLTHIVKIYEMIIENFLRQIVEEKNVTWVQTKQVHIFVLKIISMDKHEYNMKTWECNTATYSTFLDLGKNIWSILEEFWGVFREIKYGNSIRHSQVIQRMYKNGKDAVTPNYDEEIWSDMKMGVAHGVLSLLMILMMDQLLKLVKRQHEEDR